MQHVQSFTVEINKTFSDFLHLSVTSITLLLMLINILNITYDMMWIRLEDIAQIYEFGIR